MTERKNTVSRAFYKTVPVMAGYIVLGTGFGILLRNAGQGIAIVKAESFLSLAGMIKKLK